MMTSLHIIMENKDLYGEVFTPVHLVNEILEQFPRNVWSNPKIRWLDPCAGEGIFFSEVFRRLMYGLENRIPNAAKRKQHILKHMLFMYELNPANVKTLEDKFGKQANIVKGNFLEISEGLIHGHHGHHFDVILGNPPYQISKEETYTGSSGNRTLWNKFLTHSLKLLKPNGILGFITPANWRRPEHPLYKIIVFEHMLKYLHIYGKADGMKIFGAQTRFDVYLIQNHQPRIYSPYNTMLIDEKGEVYPEFQPIRWPFIPNYALPLIKNYLYKIPKDSRVIFDYSMYDSRKLSQNMNRKYKYPVIHTLTRNNVGVLYAKEELGHFKVPKVILNFNEKLYPLNDYLGKYGMSQLSFGLPIIKKEGDERSLREIGKEMIEILESQEFQTIVKATKWGSFQTDYRMFKYLKLY
jgi:Eco57I restriction-modification methylase